VPPGGKSNVTLRLESTEAPAQAVLELKGKMRTWDVPSPGALPHDPAVDPQGNIWFTLQQAGQLARFTPDTEEWKLFRVLTANSGPHGLVSDTKGYIWFTENYAGKIGRLDPKSSLVRNTRLLQRRILTRLCLDRTARCGSRAGIKFDRAFGRSDRKNDRVQRADKECASLWNRFGL